jgi:hypothetical protein
MRKTPIANSDRSVTAKWLAPALLTTGLFTITTTLSTAHPVQAVLMATAKPTVESTSVDGSVTTRSVLVRNTTAKADPRTSTTTTTSTASKNTDKKTIGRCWSRLMNMVREVREAHHNKKK